MPRKVLTSVVPDPREDGAIQVEVMLPVRSQRRTQPSPDSRPESLPRIPRISRLMALAIKFQEMADSGTVRDYADLAGLGYVTRARITQVVNLLNLAPGIQEDILVTKAAVAGREAVTERRLRSIAKLVVWADQRRAWFDHRSKSVKVVDRVGVI